MTPYSYNRTAAVPTLAATFQDYLGKLAAATAAAIPARLKADGFRVNETSRNYAAAIAKGQTRSDLDCEVSISYTIDFQPIRIRAFCTAKSVDMSKGAEIEFSIAYDEDPSELSKKIERWLSSY